MFYRNFSARPVQAALALMWSIMAGLALPVWGQVQPITRAETATKAVKRAGPASPAYDQFVRQLHSLPVPKTICYKIDRNEFTKILPPAAFLKARQNPNGRLAATSQFIVSYTGFTPEAQRAFQYAVDIWSTILVSSVPIRIQANWVQQDRGVLGSAGPTDVRVGSQGTQKANGIYAIALAEKIARRQLNNPDSADIVASFNRNNNWYYGIDANPPAGQTDLVSVVLHEICHGLGFIGYFGVPENGNVGQYLSSGFPGVYDHFIENAQGQHLVAATDLYPDNSNALFRQLTGNNLFLNGQLLRQNTGQRAKIYAPATFDRGSSLYHLDESTYPARNPNSLMTPQLGNAEAIHAPGPLVLNIMSDMEWKTTSILHDPLVSSEDIRDLVFSARVISDTVLTAGSVRLFYRRGPTTRTDSTFIAITPTRVGTTDEYRYTLPAAQAQGDIWYYFQAQDASGRTFTSPGKRPAGEQALHRVQIGPDNVPPTIRYSPAKNFIFTTALADSLPLFVTISDDRPTGVDTAYVEYQVNGQARPALPLRYNRAAVNGFVYDSLYVNQINFPANSLTAGDKITYRIVARDSSRTRNQSINPATGFYQLTVVSPQAARDRYENTFQNATAATDFVGYGFSITTPASFTNPAIHSEHPYRNGSDYQFQSNYEYVLLAPITLKANPDSAVMRYDEVVLVEPGDQGSTFGGDNFYDYVIVEGSSDNGRNWRPLVNGYDSNDQTDWLVAYNSNPVEGAPGEQNSATIGTPALFKRRQIPLLATGNFRAGQTILIRFRLFADQLAHGWGWAVDNLQIQVPPPPPVLATEPVTAGRFTVYPNPVTTGLIRIEAELNTAVAEAGLTVTGPTGQALRQSILKVGGTTLSHQLDLTSLPTGLYIVRLKAGDVVLTQKVIIAR
ncbi:T9SS type A sorting domain-containing protein [Spirosoma utsteinense]|uniref:Secretion system C-terminal sorting domain-containing protein n=1 Tax=Spirosoma utsteinense TaxID=2585773 RepID=A0ABR6W0K8_9BACT|nr:T9SS type A sorting domain-containing protein [Spirosoma utsteinense]MBC3783701.1 hypothetical protein [Spirosoma utsteinense]MBC3790156.1 hypothetical protein [Spirosoma utsteinense]